MKLLVLAAMLCALAASGAAQESAGERQGGKPDLSGTWVWDKAGSNAEAVRRYGARSGDTKNVRIEVTDEWEISKDGKHLTLTATVRSAPGHPPLSNRPPDVKIAFTRS